MKKWIFTFVFVLFMLTAARSQNIPNRGFEQWTTHQVCEEPQSWLTSNVMSIVENDTLLTVRKTDDAHTGTYALYMENLKAVKDTIAGFVFCESTVSGDFPNLKFLGGFPYSEKPDSLTGYFKYKMEPHDTARIVVVFKKNGSVISENWFLLYGEKTDYTRLAFKLNALTEDPDTAIVGLASGTPWAPMPGSYLYVDHLQFSNGTQAIPNGDFDTWDPFSYQDPTGWQSGNRITVLMGKEMCFRTEDAHSGNYALKLETVYLDFIGQNVGIVTSGQIKMANLTGGFPVKETPMVISGYYKYMPVGVDSAQVMVICSKWNDQTNSRDQEIRGFNLTPVPEYTFFSDTLKLGDAKVDTVNLVFTSGQVFGGGGSNAPGSLLYLDDLWLGSKCSYTDTMHLFTYHDTTLCMDDTIMLDAGSGYSAYLWSTDSTTQFIPVSDSGTYWVTVVDTGDCTITDSVKVHVDACTKVEPVKELRPGFRIYPNPFQESFILEMPSGLKGNIEVILTNILGQRLTEREIASGTTRLQLDMRGQPQGLYFVRIRSEQGDKIFKIIKQ